MARKNENDATIGFLLFIIFILAVGAFFLIKWAIIGLIIIIMKMMILTKRSGVNNIEFAGNRFIPRKQNKTK